MNNVYGYSSFNPNYYSMNSQNMKPNTNDRFIGGGFAFPFLLGGVTGAAIAPAFWRPGYNRPYYGPGPYYMPYRPF